MKILDFVKRRYNFKISIQYKKYKQSLNRGSVDELFEKFIEVEVDSPL